ncbi:MAG: hypothetical protein CH6_1029 [Candidatus Kapaibacterium sp.]|nr:MAG: hypothetical protein CH6_1029 [Candidatus Kapabacteria bacterium]
MKLDFLHSKAKQFARLEPTYKELKHIIIAKHIVCIID